MSITSVVNDTVTSESVINALKPLPPTISGYSVGGLDDTALDPAGGQTVQINGTGFLAGATITFDGSAVAVVTYVSPNRLTFTSPAKTAGTYTIYAVNPDGGTAIFIPGIIYSVLPTWTTSAGTLGSYYETTSISNTVVASGDAPITYSLYSGSLPTGSTLYANGVITGTAPVDSSSTTYSFTIQATDAQLQDSTRSFSLTINVDAVTWVSPANATTYTSAVDSAIANVALSATDAAGYAVSYSANALPTGLSLSGANISGTPTVIADSSTLLTATAATTNRTAVRTINWSITVANDPYFEYNTLLIPGASTTFVDDASTNNFAVTINGDTKPNNFNPYTPGYYSNYFDGTGDYLSTANNAATNLGTGDFTVEFWLNASVTQAGSNPRILSNDTWNTSAGFDIDIESSLLQFRSGGGTGKSCTFTTTDYGIWQHIAFTRSGTSFKVFKNGVLANTYTDSSNLTSANPTYIGKYAAATGSDFTGYISNLRIVKGTAVYTSAFTPPTTPLTAIANTSLLTCQSNRFIDNSTNNFTITVAGNTSISSFDPFVPNTSYSTYGSGYFDGTTDFVKTPSDASLSSTLLASNFTIECWVYVTSLPNAPTIWTNSTSNSDGFSGSYIQTNGTIGTGKYGVNEFNTTNTVKLNTWTHFALVSNSGTLYVYLNGVQDPTTGAASTYLNTSATKPMQIGSSNQSPPAAIQGFISDFRVVASAVYTTAFTPPSVPLTAIANTQLLTLQNNQSVNNNIFLDNSTNNFFVTRNGNTTQGTFSPYGGNWSNYFGTKTDYISTPATTALTTFTGDFTFECWVNPTDTSLSTTWGIWDSRQSGQTAGAMIFFLTALASPVTGQYRLSYYNGTQYYGTGVILANQWSHVAFVRSGSTMTFYVNGVAGGTATISGTQTGTATSNPVYIGTKDSSLAGYGTVGYISNFRIVNGTAVYTSAFTPSTTPLTPITNTVLLTCGDNRLVDDSLNNYTLTPSTTLSVQRFSPFNPSSVTPTSYSGYFDGNGDYLTVPFNSAFNLGSGNFTIEFWVRTTSTVAYATALRLGDTWTTGSWALYLNDSGGSGIPSWWSQTLSNTLTSSGATINDGVWHHIALVRNSATMTMYIDGTSRGTLSVGANSVGDTSTSLWIARDASNVRELAGYLSNIRIVKGTALYTTTFTPSTTPLTTTSQGATASQVSLLTLQSTTFIDNSTNNFTISAFGNSKPTIQNPFGFTSATTNGYTVSTIGGSGYFDGTGDYLTVPSNTAFYLSTGNWTIEAWIYKRTSGKQIIVGQSQNNGSPYAGWTLYVDNSSLIVFEGTNGALIGSPTVAVPLNAWTHVAVVKSSSTVTIYQNGVSVNSGGAPSVTDYNTVLAIGNYSSYVSGADWNGYISDLRIVKGTAIYSSNFVPPAAPILSVQNTSLLTNMTSAGVYDASMMNNMETVGDAKLSTAVSKFGGSSMAFDGTGDWIQAPNNAIYNLGSGDFTIEFWLYVVANPSVAAGVITKASNSGNTGYTILYYPTGFVGFAIGSGGLSVQTAASSIPLTTWTYVAITRSGTSGKFFINGTQSGSTGTINNFTDSSTVLAIGALDTSTGWNGPYPLNGYIDDLRITKGYARYTSNFTAPTTAFPIY